MNQTETFKKVTHVIFDMDGLLLDTEPLYTQAIQKVVSKYGKHFDWHIKAHIIGLMGIAAAQRMKELLDLPIPVEEFNELLQAEYLNVFQDVQIMPGAEKLVGHLHDHKIPICVATSSSKESVELKSRKHKEFFALFDHIVCGGSDAEVKEGKPKPDIFLVAASRFPGKPAPEHCLVFEDAPNGVQAAISAGMQVVMVPDENVSDELRKGANLVVTSLKEIPLELFGLPPL